MKARGFTILEILVVITVVAVLITVAVPKFKGMQEQGKISKAKSELKTLQTALESYYIHHSSYPNPATFMADLTGATPQIVSGTMSDPFAANGTDTYKYSKNGGYFAVWSVGPNHASATADIDASGNVSPGGDDILATNGLLGAGGTPPGSVADGQACANNVDCASGTCTSGSCATTPGSIANGNPCTTDTDCDWGVCSPRSGFANPVLNGYFCGFPVGEGCSNDSDCVYGNCSVSYGTCGGEGASCTIDDSCATGTCSGGTVCGY